MNRFIPILETRLLLHTLIDIPYINEKQGTQILKDLTNCMENHWYSLKDTWNCKTIIRELKKLHRFVINDYRISGSIVIYDDGNIQWDLNVSMVS